MGVYHFATLPYFITMCSIYLSPIQAKSRLVLLCLQGNLWMGNWFPKAQTHPSDYAVAPEGTLREEGPSCLEQLEGAQAWHIRHLAPPTSLTVMERGGTCPALHRRTCGTQSWRQAPETSTQSPRPRSGSQESGWALRSCWVRGSGVT